MTIPDARWRTCGAEGCDRFADHECTCLGTHPDDGHGKRHPEDVTTDHPLWVCDTHAEELGS